MGIMPSYPVEIRRCRHVKTNGTQCGSPALKDKELCYFHEQNRPLPAELYLDGETYCDGQIILPPFEDAHSIQSVIRHVVRLMLTRRIERKDASLMLYALQIAAGNLKMMQAEKPKPTQVVVEPEKAGETPLGMTPWSARGHGHDREEGEEETEEDSPGRPPTVEECYAAMSIEERSAMRSGLEAEKLISAGDTWDWNTRDGPDPLLPAMKLLREEQERMRRV
jgi:hypothetical protein